MLPIECEGNLVNIRHFLRTVSGSEMKEELKTEFTCGKDILKYMLVRKSVKSSLILVLELLLDVLRWTSPNECLNQHHSINGKLLQHCPLDIIAKIVVLCRDSGRKRTVANNL